MSESSSTSNLRRQHRYRTRAPSSQVDESLFEKKTRRSSHSASKAKDVSAQKQMGNTIQIVTKDLVRNLRVPCSDPSGQSIILPFADFERITARSNILSKDENKALKEAHKSRKEKEMAAEEMKRQMLEADVCRQEKRTLSEVEMEAHERTQHLLERAHALRMEQEEEIRELNKVILGAQCQAIRDAQIQEKKRIQMEMLQEEKRLDAMMEAERRKFLDRLEQTDELRKQERISGKQQIFQQMQQRLEEKLVQEELKEQEKDETREKQARMNMEDLMALKKRRDEQQRLHQEVMRINAETLRAQQLRREEEKLADRKEMEYIKNKLQREAEYEAEQKRMKREKELEIAKLRAQQERARDHKADQDELRAKRNQEIADREWRRKELEMAAKKVQEEATLRAARLEQVQRKEQLLSMEAGREKAEFERVLKVQQEASVRQNEEDQKRRQKALRHAEAIRQQVKELEMANVTKCQETFKEAEKLSEEARQRRKRIGDIKRKKLKELKAIGLSEKYCSQVERKVWPF
ncbi:cilia- and flagella-associated protein 45 isoform X2 [Hippocampus zosterae]|uniref:cilia- and flagella-associated protein 45 isoform X2 n=1 Tax=Hippocampus zosterae TaxID=109293 RepID=UPI00223C93FF|nr:cilia- and flagella-associated protein 45 isoform X2 [Hippocampus zosterae]